MPGGDDWHPEIERKLRECDVFILLVSRHLMASDYVVEKEMAIIRERQAKAEDVHVYPLLLTPTPDIAVERVQDKNLRPRDRKPFRTIRSTTATCIWPTQRTRSPQSRGRSPRGRASRRLHCSPRLLRRPSGSLLRASRPIPG